MLYVITLHLFGSKNSAWIERSRDLNATNQPLCIVNKIINTCSFFTRKLYSLKSGFVKRKRVEKVLTHGYNNVCTVCTRKSLKTSQGTWLQIPDSTSVFFSKM